MSRPLAVSQSVSLAKGGTARSGIGLVRNEPHPIDDQHPKHVGHDVRQVLAGRPR